MLIRSAIICAAWVLDAVLGDPEAMPHPIRWIGKLITLAESAWLLAVPSRRAAGVLLGISVPGAVFLLALMLVKLAEAAGPPAGALVSAGMIYFCISTRCLGDEARAVLRALQGESPEPARRRLARIVGRDTEDMTREDVVRATVESVGENTVDGIIAPLFYAFIGGAPLALAYKAVNTLDSMVGYRNERYRELGWFSARMDDAVNFVPARLCLALVPLAVTFLKPGRVLSTLRIGMRDGRKSPSPNAGFPEACFAGALGIQLGGACTYGGLPHSKPLIGDRERPCRVQDIMQAVRLMWLVSACSLACFSAGSLPVGYL